MKIIKKAETRSSVWYFEYGRRTYSVHSDGSIYVWNKKKMDYDALSTSNIPRAMIALALQGNPFTSEALILGI